MDRIRTTEAIKDAVMTFVYVAMTRARYRPVLPYVEQTAIIRRMKYAPHKGSSHPVSGQ